MGRTADGAPVRLSEYFDLNNFETFKSTRQYYVIRNRKPEQETAAGERPSRTVVVLGTGRSGTTMTMSVLKLLGEELGDNLDRHLEDKELTACIASVYHSFLFWRIVTLRRRFSKIMEDRNRRWKRWAFKYPYPTAFFMILSGRIPNPYFIVPTRNLLETSFGLTRYVRGGWRTSFVAATVQQIFLTIFCMMTRRPLMLFSYEHVTERDADGFVDVLADFLSIDIDDAKKRAAVECIDPKRGYASVPGVVGQIDHLTKAGIKGWVSNTRQPQQSVTVEIRLDNRIIARVRANQTRLDVRDAGYHRTGACGFDVVFDVPLRDEDLKHIHLFAPNTGEPSVLLPSQTPRY